MKLAPLAALGLALAAMTAPVAASAQSDVTAAPTAAAFSLDTPIETLMADDRAKAVLLANLPGIDQHPAYEQFKALSLTTLAPFSQGMITEEMLAKIGTDLAAIG
jgi:parvulin-like peptidyl-prolyl isomerase